MIICNGKSHAGRGGKHSSLSGSTVCTIGESPRWVLLWSSLVVVSAAVFSVWSCLSLGGEVPLEMAVSHHLAAIVTSRGFPGDPGDLGKDHVNSFNVIMGPRDSRCWGRLCHIV